jgi:hypothetical protein
MGRRERRVVAPSYSAPSEYMKTGFLRTIGDIAIINPVYAIT